MIFSCGVEDWVIVFESFDVFEYDIMVVSIFVYGGCIIVVVVVVNIM